MSGHARERAAWFVAALAGAAAAAAPGGALPAPLAALALAITFGIVPGAWLAHQLAPDEASDARASFALLLSPFVSGACLAIARLAGAPGVLAAQGFAVASALLAAWEALRPRARETPPSSMRAVWGLALGVGAAIVLAHALQPLLSSRSDGSFHAGVAWATARQLPPEDPFFAGLPLRYFWGLHAWAAGWLALAPRLGAYAPLMLANAAAAVAALLAVGALARRLGATSRVCVLAQALALAGAAPFTWLVLVARMASGDVRGAAELRQALGQGGETALRALDPGLLHPSLVLPLDKFVVLTPFAWALAGAAVMALAVAAACDQRSWRTALRLGLGLAAVMFAHPVGGLALAAALLVAAAGLGASVRSARITAAILAAATLAACALMIPYLLSFARWGDGAAVPARLAPQLTGILSAAIAGAFLLPAAAVVLFRARALEALHGWLLLVLAALVLPACVLRLEGDNQSKFLNLAFLIASAPAAIGWANLAARRGLRPAIAGLLLVALLPTLVAVLWAYAHQSAASADAPSRPPPAILSAVAELVPRDGVLVDATQDTTRGAAPALPGETGRSLLWSGDFLAHKWGYAEPALLLRADAARSLGQGAWPEGRTGEWLESLEREVWVIARDEPARAPDPRERVVARAEGGRLVRWEPR